MSDIGYAEAHDLAALLALWGRCFSDDAETWRRFGDRVWRPEDTLVLREDGVIRSALTLLPCALRSGERAHCVYAVATAPEARGEGRMAALLGAAEREMRCRGDDLAVLTVERPSLLAYYARFGYQPVGTAGVGRPEAGVCAPRRMEESDLPQAAALFERVSAGRTVLLRDEAFWRLRLWEYGAGAAVCGDEELTGCCFADERGVTEAFGPDAAVLVHAWAPHAREYLTLPSAALPERVIGCALPLTARGARRISEGTVYVNMMLN